MSKRLTRGELRSLLACDRLQHGGSNKTLAEDIGCGFHTLITWQQNTLRFPGSASTDLKIINYLIERGYITITTSNKPIKF